MLDWEENVFVGLRALYRRAFLRPEQRRREAVQASLKGIRRRQLLLAQSIAGRPLGLFESDERRLCVRDRVLLPSSFAEASSQEANVAFLELKTALAALAIRDRALRNGAGLRIRAEGWMEEFPGLAERIERVREALPPGADVWDWLGELPEKDELGEEEAAVPGSPPAPGEGPHGAVSTEMEGRGQSSVTVLPTQEDFGPGEEVPQHAFEKVETLEEYSGQGAKPDADDQLAEHAEALEEVRLTQVFRSAERASSIYRSDLILDGAALEVAAAANPGGIPYPEWDHRKRRYRENWCFVQAGPFVETEPGWARQAALRHRALIRRLRREFAALIAERVRLRRQLSGSEFDLDALIASEVERRTGHTPDEAVHLDVRHECHDVAALILVDGSDSTDAWLDNRRVLDLIREIVFCVGEVLDEHLERLALATFSSRTRHACRFDILKDFREPWPRVGDRLGAIRPGGYTRMGPALRHAQELLNRQPAARKLVILITDGRPCDYDQYEGHHGIQDVKKAIETGGQNGIETHAFAVERRAAEYFPRMFTPRHYDIVPSPERLARTLCRLFARLLAGR